MNFKKNDLVRYLSDEVCRITSIEKIDATGEGKPKKYYVLKPVFDARSTKYIPCDYAETNGMRAILSADEINDCFKLAKVKECPWLDNEAERKTLFKEVINSCDFRKMIALLKTIKRKEQTLEANKSLKAQDETTFKEAFKLVAGEIAVAYNFTSLEDGEKELERRIKPRARKS